MRSAPCRLPCRGHVYCWLFRLRKALDSTRAPSSHGTEYLSRIMVQRHEGEEGRTSLRSVVGGLSYGGLCKPSMCTSHVSSTETTIGLTRKVGGVTCSIVDLPFTARQGFSGVWVSIAIRHATTRRPLTTPFISGRPCIPRLDNWTTGLPRTSAQESNSTSTRCGHRSDLWKVHHHASFSPTSQKATNRRPHLCE